MEGEGPFCWWLSRPLGREGGPPSLAMLACVFGGANNGGDCTPRGRLSSRALDQVQHIDRCNNSQHCRVKHLRRFSFIQRAAPHARTRPATRPLLYGHPAGTVTFAPPWFSPWFSPWLPDCEGSATQALSVSQTVSAALSSPTRRRSPWPLVPTRCCVSQFMSVALVVLRSSNAMCS